jgi:hypothetical protein
MVLDRILGLMGLFLLASIAGGFAFGSAARPVRILIALVWLGFSCGVFALAVAFSPGLYRPLNRLVAGRGKLELVVQKLEQIGMAYRERLGTVVALLGVSTGVHSLYVIAFYVASVALFDDLPSLVDHFLMVPLILFSTAVPIPFGALGLSEKVGGLLFEMVHHADGAIAMLAFRTLMYGSGVVSACVYLANLGQVRELKQAAEGELPEAA